jgi:hypothetical protein
MAHLGSSVCIFTLILACVSGENCADHSGRVNLDECVASSSVCAFCLPTDTCIHTDPCANSTTPECPGRDFLPSLVSCQQFMRLPRDAIIAVASLLMVADALFLAHYFAGERVRNQISKRNCNSDVFTAFFVCAFMATVVLLTTLLSTMDRSGERWIYSASVAVCFANLAAVPIAACYACRAFWVDCFSACFGAYCRRGAVADRCTDRTPLVQDAECAKV